MNETLALRLLNALPAGAYELTALLGLLRIEESRDVPTAAVTCERRPVLKLNPEFVAERCASDEHLFILVMHEIHHVLLGHTRLFLRPTPLHNLAFDAVINALLCSRFPRSAHTSFFLGYYGKEKGALRLLAPPAGEPIGDPKLRRLHDLLYSNAGDVTCLEVFERLVGTLAEGGLVLGEAGRLLGSHGAEGDDDYGTAGPLPADVVEAIRKIVEKWPPPPDALRGRSLADTLETHEAPPASPGERVLSALRRALDDAAIGGARPGSARQAGRVPAIVPIPSPHDRRAAVARLAGSTPLLYAGEVEMPKARASGRAVVYLDVSGSMDAYLPFLCGGLSRLRDRVDPCVRAFSTKVVAVGLDALARGKLPTTGGTDGACVLSHVLAARTRKVLVVTDGYVGATEPAIAEQVRRARIDVRVLLTPGGWRRDLEGVASRLVTLPELQPTRRSA